MQSKKGAAKPKKQQSLLIVDDDPNFRQLLVEILKPSGFEIIEARCAKDGIAACENDIGLAIVDYRLPDIDGMTFISQLREAGKTMAIVFISSAFCDAKTFSYRRTRQIAAHALQS